MTARIALAAFRIQKPGSTPAYSSREELVRAILAAGGRPYLLPSALPLEDIPEVISEFDGLFISGGGDIHPDFFGGEMHPSLDGIDRERDEFELTLCRQAVAVNKAILGICRGQQVLNVAMGGNLVIDIPSMLPEASKHQWWPNYQRSRLSHSVKLEKDSRLADIMGGTEFEVNSLHHQYVKDPGEGLKVVATAPDGVIEALEMPGKNFVLSVQWHPEWLLDSAPMRRIFKAFVDASGTELGG
jgi:putative glutamine amidotransferase